MKNKIKLSILLIPAFIFVSCRNFFSDDLIERKDSEITVLQGYYSLENNYSARTAIPFPELSTYTFEITAESQETPPADSVDGVIDSAHNSYSIELTDGNWKLAINGYKDAAKTEKALCAENNITIDNCGITAGSLNFVLQMFQTPLAVTADVLLPIEVTSEISRVEALWKESGIEKKQTIIQNSSSTSGNFTMINDGETTITAVNGNYDVLFRFYKKIGAAEVIAYSLVEKINLYDYLTTNKWIGNSSSPLYKNGKLVISDNIIKTYDKDIFYVSSSGSDATNSGGFFDPFASVQSAVEIIQAIADPEVEQYTIYLKDNITLAPDYTDWPMQSDGVTPEDSYVTINPSSSLKIKITSYGEPAAPYSINANRSAANTGRVMYVGEKAEVTIENLCISGGFSQNDGAGVYINKGKLILNNGAEVTDSFVAAADLYAAGVYNLEGTITMNNGSSIHDNGDDVNAANGGGVYCKTGSLYMNPGSKIYGNTGKSGAGIKLLSSKGVIDGAEIYGNKVSVATDNGGGIWYSPNVLNPEALEIKDTQIYMNEAPGGAGLYSKGDVKISGNTEFNVNHASGMGGGILNISGIVDISDSVKFNSNTAAKGSAVYLAETQGVELHLKDKVAFENSIATQTIYGKYNATKAAYPVIKLGTFAGNAADQILNLVFDSYNTGSIVITPDTGVDISTMVTNINVLKEDLTASIYFVDTDGTLETNIVIGPNGGNASSAYTVVSTIEACGGTLPAAGVYSLSTEAELEQLALWSESGGFGSYTFVLYDNIHLTSTDFNTICKSKNFTGTFDGNGNKITGLSINSSTSNTGLFGKGSSCTIKNLYVEGKITSSAGTIGGIIGTTSASDAVIDNCVSNVDIICTSGGSVGGIVGNAASPVTNCINLGNITGSSGGSCVGGIAGASNKNIINCANFGAVTGHMNVAGICGQLDDNGIANCYNFGKITADSSFGAIEGKGSAGPFSELYYHPNSGVTAAVYNKVDNIEYDIGTFTDPDALRLTLNANLMNPAYSTLSLAEWNYDYKIDGVKYPVCTTFALPEKIGVNLSDLASAPSDNSVPYIMKTQADIEKLAGWVNSGISFAGFEFKIPEEVSDIALSGSWTPVGTSGKPFRGTFDGGNVTISSVAISGGRGSGFFGYVENATIRNVKLDGSLTVTGTDCGGLVGSATGNILIENCDIKMVVNGGSNNDIGGVLGFYDGDSSSNITIRNCINRSSITGTANIGGIVGLIYSIANLNLNVIENCANYGGVTGTGSNVGGIAGQINKTKMENCLSNPTNVISGTTNVGNVCGNASTGCEVNYCYYLTYVATDDIYCGNSTITPANCNIFRVMDTKYQVYNAGNSVISTYPADADLCDIMNDWVNAKNATSPGYLSWKYESSLMEFIE